MAELEVNKNSLFMTIMTPWITFLKHLITSINMWILKKSNGRLGNSFLGVSVLLLYTTGAKSGLERVTPLFYLQHEGKVILLASNGGNTKNPAWFNNLNANPESKVNIKGKETNMVAHIATSEGCDLNLMWRFSP